MCPGDIQAPKSRTNVADPGRGGQTGAARIHLGRAARLDASRRRVCGKASWKCCEINAISLVQNEAWRIENGRSALNLRFLASGSLTCRVGGSYKPLISDGARP